MNSDHILSSRRHDLRAVQDHGGSHAGLWLERYPKHLLRRERPLPSGEQSPAVQVMAQASAVEAPEIYRKFYDRWRAGLLACGARCREAEIVGRMVVGLGDESVLETAITLHHTYGVPHIPGSALKGLAARFAHQRLADPRWQQDGEAYKVLVGDTSKMGYVVFFDALYVPGSGAQRRPLHPDVMTVHHPNYYQRGATPTDADSPTPIPFLSATGRYLIALAGPGAWVEAAFEILEHALREEGVGAKTSSGYGRMTLGGPI